MFLTVSQSPDIKQLSLKIWGHITGSESNVLDLQSPEQYNRWVGQKRLIVLDDVWSLSVLEKLIFRGKGCKTLVVSRFGFPTVTKLSHKVELLREDEALSLFCFSAFGQNSVPRTGDEKLAKQVTFVIRSFFFIAICLIQLGKRRDEKRNTESFFVETSY